jgi:DNA-binding Lrp family transcriptional regulator
MIRRIGASFDSRRLGYRSALCALAVTRPEDVEAAAAAINAYPNVTHNYLREHRYNVWFTVIAPSEEAIKQILAEVAEQTGYSDLLYLPATRLYKIRVDFDLTKQPAPGQEAAAPAAAPAAGGSAAAGKPSQLQLSDLDKALVRQLQGNLAGELEPFAQIAAALLAQGYHTSEQEVLSRTQELVDAKAIRRFGAMVRHHQLGFTHNVMVAWQIADEQTDAAGELMAQNPNVSHCYRRITAPTWLYNMYSMVHGMSAAQCEEAVAAIKAALDAQHIAYEPPALLYSIQELKKTSMLYFMES